MMLMSCSGSRFGGIVNFGNGAIKRDIEHLSYANIPEYYRFICIHFLYANINEEMYIIL